MKILKMKDRKRKKKCDDKKESVQQYKKCVENIECQKAKYQKNPEVLLT